jgi:hypothetical protein
LYKNRSAVKIRSLLIMETTSTWFVVGYGLVVRMLSSQPVNLGSITVKGNFLFYVIMLLILRVCYSDFVEYRHAIRKVRAVNLCCGNHFGNFGLFVA